MNSKQLVTSGLLINEIATNSLKYGFNEHETPVFSLDIKKQEDECLVKISNNGEPIPENVNLDYPETLGMRLIAALTEQLGGSVELTKNPSPEYNLKFNLNN